MSGSYAETGSGWAQPLGPPPLPPVAQQSPSAEVKLPAGVVEGLTLGPADILVIRVSAHATAALFEQVTAQIEAGPLRGRVLLVAAEQIAAVRA